MAGGGGAMYCLLTNCVLLANSSWYGGGALFSDLVNCVVVSNSAAYGGGLELGVGSVRNCVLVGNSATLQAGGCDGGFVMNSVVVDNFAPAIPNTLYSEHSCTFPMPTNGIGNFTNPPLFVNPAAGDFRLQANSPCINAGRDAYVLAKTDLDGNPRIVGGRVDVGAYEFQTPASTISYQWLQQYGLPTDGSADSSDPDGDGHNNWQEWRAGTDPKNALSLLKMLSISNVTSGLKVTWSSVSDRYYALERASTPGPATLFMTIRSNLVGQPDATTFTDTNLFSRGFYRVQVEE